MRRTPPIGVIRALRQEVGFSCPVSDCGNPYLSWHHFDPPWAEEEHQRPEGMIALCLEHARKADGGAFTNEQLSQFKQEGRERAAAIVGSFDWMRRDLTVALGGSLFTRINPIVAYGEEPGIWLSRDERGYLLVNFWMPSSSGESRAEVVDNIWIVPPDVADVTCPPTGRLLEVRYTNGDHFKMEFFDIQNSDELADRYGFSSEPDDEVDSGSETAGYPMTVVEIVQTALDSHFEITPNEIRVGTNRISGVVAASAGGAGLRLPALEPGVGGMTYDGQDIHLPGLVPNDFIRHARFSNCRLSGPCVLYPGGSSIIGGKFDRPFEDVVWIEDHESLIFRAGVVVARQCLFENCEFENVGVAVARGQVIDAMFGLQAPGDGQ